MDYNFAACSSIHGSVIAFAETTARIFRNSDGEALNNSDQANWFQHIMPPTFSSPGFPKLAVNRLGLGNTHIDKSRQKYNFRSEPEIRYIKHIEQVSNEVLALWLRHTYVRQYAIKPASLVLLGGPSEIRTGCVFHYIKRTCGIWRRVHPR